jgi:hypothetical protein
MIISDLEILRLILYHKRSFDIVEVNGFSDSLVGTHVFGRIKGKKRKKKIWVYHYTKLGLGSNQMLETITERVN